MNEDVVLSYSRAMICRDEHIVFSDFNLEVHEGEFVYLVGPVGSGKSTLLRSIYAEVPIQEGDCSVLGYNLSKISTRKRQELRRNLGIVFQDFQLLQDRTVYANLDIVLNAWGEKSSKGRRERIQEVLALVGLQNKGYKYPSELSGGEQQCVAIARAILGNPKLILADEPTANLDADNGLAIAQLLHELTRKHNIAVVMATHNTLVLETYPSRIISL